MTTRPMPKHADRYLSQPCGPFADGFYAWLVRNNRHAPQLLRAVALPLVYLILFGCFLADEIDLQLAQLRFRTIDRVAERLMQALVLFSAMMLAIWILDALLSGAFSRAVR